MTAPGTGDSRPQQVLVVGPDGQPVGALPVSSDGDDGAAMTGVGDLVEQPAKVMRIGTMIKQLLEEVRAAPLDDASRNRLRDIHASSIRELEQVKEILPFPSAVTRTSVPGLLGLITHRRAVVPVLCLSTLLGREQRGVGPSTCLLLVEVDDGMVAFAVDTLRSIAPLTWTDADQAVRGATEDRGTTLRSAPLVRIGEGSRLLPDLDLRALAQRLGSAAAPPLASRAVAQLV